MKMVTVTRRQDDREGTPPHGWEGSLVGGVGDGLEGNGDAGALPGRVDDLRVWCQGPDGRYHGYQREHPPPWLGRYLRDAKELRDLPQAAGPNPPLPEKKRDRLHV